MSIITCQYCRAHTVPFATVTYEDESHHVNYDMCQACIGRLVELGNIVNDEHMSAETQLVALYEKIDRRLSELMAKFK